VGSVFCGLVGLRSLPAGVWPVDAWACCGGGFVFGWCCILLGLGFDLCSGYSVGLLGWFAVTKVIL